MILKIENKLDEIGDIFSKNYTNIIILTYILYFLFFFGVVSVNYKYLRYFSSFVQFCIAIFLIIRFNPFRKNISLREGDSAIIYSSGVFLLINLGFTEFIIYFYNDIKEKLKKWGIIN